MKLFGPLYLIFFTLTLSFGQVTVDSEVIHQLAKLRTLLVEGVSNHEDLKATTDKWSEKEINSDEFYSAVRTIYELKNHCTVTDYHVLIIVKKRYPTINFEKLISQSDIQTISENMDILYFIFEDVLSLHYPYVLIRNPKLLDEIKFYDLSKKDKVAHIEGNRSMVALIMCMVNTDTELSLNEYNWKVLNKIKNDLDEIECFVDIENVTAENWNRKNLEMIENAYHKVVIRNLYHHYKKRKSKLKTIHSGLKKDGELILLEPDAALDKTNAVCRKSLKLDKIVSSVESADFRLIEKMQLKDHYFLLKFKKREDVANIKA